MQHACMIQAGYQKGWGWGGGGVGGKVMISSRDKEFHSFVHRLKGIVWFCVEFGTGTSKKQETKQNKKPKEQQQQQKNGRE